MTQGLLFPKPDSTKAKRKRQTDRKVRRLDAATEAKTLDKRCMNPECLMHHRPGYCFLEAHHIIKRRPNAPELDHPDNLISFCHHCHRLAEDGDKTQTAREFVLGVLKFWRKQACWRWEKAYEELKRRA